MQRVLAVVIALLLAAGTVSAVRIKGDESGRSGAAHTDGGGQVIAGQPLEANAARPGRGQVRVTGTVTELEGAALVGGRLALPATLDADERGTGRARIEAATVGGKPDAVIVWDSGRPLPVNGQGQLALDAPARLTIADGKARWYVDGAARSLSVGRYRLGATVAVGRSGLAQPRDGVEFDAVPATTMQTSGAVFVETTGPITAAGPSPLVVRGSLALLRPDGKSEAVSGISFPGGPLAIELLFSDGEWTISALLQGTTVAVS